MTVAATPPKVKGAWPLIGHLPQYFRQPIDFIRDGYEQNGPVFRMDLGGQKMVVLIGPELHAFFFAKTDTIFRMDKAYRFLKAMFGEIAFAAGPEQYKAEQHILRAPFKSSKMPRYVKVMDEEIQAWLDSLGDSGEFELVATMRRVTQYVAAHALMGYKFRHELGDEFWPLYDAIGESLDPVMPPNLPLPKYRRRDKARAAMLKLLSPIIAERRENPEGHDDFLQEFIASKYKDGTPMSDEQIMNYILGFIFAGHETTSGQGSWAIIDLLSHPSYFARVMNEIDRTCPDGQNIDLAKIAELEVLLRGVRESERMRPVSDMLMRYIEEDVEVGGYQLRKGWVAVICPAVAHRIPDIFADPDAFDPDRFTEERNEGGQHRNTFITFGGGVHKCTGMNFAYNEMIMVAAKLFSQFECELLTPNPKSIHGMGASHPDATTIRYRRRRSATPVKRHVAEATAAAACPHVQAASAREALGG